jgi:hypothetical protein
MNNCCFCSISNQNTVIFPNPLLVHQSPRCTPMSNFSWFWGFRKFFSKLLESSFLKFRQFLRWYISYSQPKYRSILTRTWNSVPGLHSFMTRRGINPHRKINPRTKALYQDPEIWEYLNGILKESSDSLNLWTVIKKRVCSERTPGISDMLDISKGPTGIETTG